MTGDGRCAVRAGPAAYALQVEPAYVLNATRSMRGAQRFYAEIHACVRFTAVGSTNHRCCLLRANAGTNSKGKAHRSRRDPCNAREEVNHFFLSLKQNESKTYNFFFISFFVFKFFFYRWSASRLALTDIGVSPGTLRKVKFPG